MIRQLYSNVASGYHDCYRNELLPILLSYKWWFSLSQQTANFLDSASEQYQSTETLFSHVPKTRARNQRLNYLRVAPFYGTIMRETGVLGTPEDL